MEKMKYGLLLWSQDAPSKSRVLEFGLRVLVFGLTVKLILTKLTYKMKTTHPQPILETKHYLTFILSW